MINKSNMLKVDIEQVVDGYWVTYSGTIKHNGKHVVKNTEEFAFLEKLGEIMLGYKVRVERR